MQSEQANRLIGLYNKGDMQAVLRLGGPLLMAHPKAILLHNLMGAAQAAMGRHDRAVLHFKEAAALNPSDPAAHGNLGVALNDMGEAEAALRCFQEAVRLDPKQAGPKLMLGETLRQLGRLEEARSAFADALALNASLPEAHTSLGIVLKDLGRMAEAIESFRRSAALTPQDATAQLNLGGALSDAGCAEDAIQAYMQALAIEPNNAATHFNLGVAQKRAGLLEAAIASYGKAIALSPKDAGYHNTLGLALREASRRRDAIESFTAAIAVAPDHAEAHNNLGLTLSEAGRFDEAAQAVERAIALRPGYPSANINLVNIRNHQVPLWHVGMMNDAPRNAAFFQGIEAAVAPGDLVLEIGAGSGLLAMKAADSGADRVVTCEMSAPIAAVATRIVAANGFAGRVAVLNKKSTDIRLPEDLPRPADVIVAEILSSEFVGEGVVASLRDSRQRLLAEGGRMVPAGGAIMVALLADAPGLGARAYVDRVGGYDLSAFNAVTANKVDFTFAGEDIRFLADPIESFAFDFTDPAAFANRDARFTITPERDGKCIGILQWNKVDLGAGIFYENDPRTVPSHWSTPLYRFDRPRRLRAGEPVIIEASLAEDSVWFRLGDA